MAEITFQLDDSYLPIPIYVVILDKVPHIATSQDVFNWLIYIGDNWITCDKRYTPAIYEIKKYKDLKQAVEKFPELRLDFYYILIKVIPVPLNVKTIETATFKALLSQLSRFIKRLEKTTQ
jgi:hypothetical protein